MALLAESVRGVCCVMYDIIVSAYCREEVEKPMAPNKQIPSGVTIAIKPILPIRLISGINILPRKDFN